MHLYAAYPHALPAGKTSNSSSLRIVPETSVPVTTVPKPFMVKTRSMGRRASAVESLAGTSAAIRASACFSSSKPAPVRELTATIGEWHGSRNDPAQEFFDFQLDHVESLAIHRVRLGQHRDAAPHRQQTADVEMLARLGLDRFVGGDHQQHQIDAADPGQHVAHKAFVSRDIDESQAQLFAVRRSQLKVRKPDVDRDSPALLFLEAIGVNAGKGFDECGFPVIDMSGGADDDATSCGEQYSWTATVIGSRRAPR